MTYARFRLFSSLFLPLLVSGFFANAEQQKGIVASGLSPVAGSVVTLYQAGTVRGDSALPLGSAVTDRLGRFTIRYKAPQDNSCVLYLIADGEKGRPHAGVRLATVLGAGQAGTSVVINERTTVATAYTMAQFLSGVNIAGNSPGVPNAALTLRNLVSISTGSTGVVLSSPPNGNRTSTLAEFNTLANLLASCVAASTDAPCRALFRAAGAEGVDPTDTLQAAVTIAHFPANNVAGLYQLSQGSGSYVPRLQAAPAAWTLAIRYDGNGHEMDGPGTMVFDKDGNIWSSNNYDYQKSPFTQACGGLTVLKLTPDGKDAPGAPYSGGGLYGAGFGIALDLDGNAWVGNFGFEGVGDKTCSGDITTVSEFTPGGQPLSGDGFHQGPLYQPQGMATDQQGNLWIANCGAGSVTEYPRANPYAARTFSQGLGLNKTFGLAVDGNGDIWVANNGGSSITVIHPDGTKAAILSGSGISRPLGVAIDSHNNAWVANSGVIPLPCETSSEVAPPTAARSISEISPNGKTYTINTFKGGGLTVPWGIAVDGNDNVWVANFGQRRLSEFCGSSPENCPAGKKTGDPISPDGGFGFDGLSRNTGVVIDASGNVWLANNWLELAVQTNPGGRELVVFIGAAAPVRTPMVGPPQQP